MDDFRADRPTPVRARGTAGNPANRFKPSERVPEEPAARPETVFLTDSSRSILSYNDSPDVGFDVGVNPYRGCEHGCVYCYARPTHEYFEMSAGLDFETRILVKENAPALLTRELSSPRWQPQMIALSGITDVYQPGEKKHRLTRECLKVLLRFRNPVGIITKNQLVTRDIDLLQQLVRFDCAAVFVSITTLNAELSRNMEPRASLPEQRLAAIRALSEARIPVGVMAAPVIPALTDHELPAILKAAADAGAETAGYTVVKLPYGVKDLFSDWLEVHYPDKKQKVLQRIRAVRGGKLNDPNFGSRMTGEGIFAEQIARMFDIAARRTGLDRPGRELSTKHFVNAEDKQLRLF